MSTQHKSAFDHSGSSFDSFLEEEGIRDEVDAAAIQRVVDAQRDIAARTDAGVGIRQGLEDVRKGTVRPARQFFVEFEATQGLSGQDRCSRRA